MKYSNKYVIIECFDKQTYFLRDEQKMGISPFCSIEKKFIDYHEYVLGIEVRAMLESFDINDFE